MKHQFCDSFQNSNDKKENTVWKPRTLNQVADALAPLGLQNRMDRVMHVHVHGDIDEFSKTGAKSRSSVIDSAKIMLFPAVSKSQESAQKC